MKKIFTVVVVLLAALCTVAVGQKYDYTFVKVFPDSTLKFGNGAHGIAVDGAGKIWVQLYSASDSILNAAAKYQKCRILNIYNPNGTKATISGIKTVTVGSVTDTLWNSGLGLATSSDGNIIVSTFDTYYKINSTTGVGMVKKAPQPGTSLTACAVDSAGEVFTAHVLQGVGPIRIFDKNGTFVGNVVDTTRAFSRTIAVSRNGNDVYYAGFTNGFVTRFHSDNGSLGPYSKIDTIMKGFTAEAFAWHPKTGYLWAGCGDGTSGLNSSGFPSYAFYAFAPPNFTTPVDGFVWNSPSTLGTSNDPRPRGIAFSPTGDTVYVAAFNTSNPCILMYVRASVLSVQRVSPTVPDGFVLEQNYPNPFNPTTEIRFSIAQAGATSLRVYDVLGREVAVLMNGDLAPGTYRATFDASKMSSGTYIYVLRSGDVRLVKKMMLMK